MTNKTKGYFSPQHQHVIHGHSPVTPRPFKTKKTNTSKKSLL